MIPELGNFALMLAALVAVMQGVLPIAGTLVRNPQTQVTLQSLARPTAALQFVLVAFAFGALASAFLNNDFSVLYVSQHSNSLLPKPYQFAAVWGGHEGSLLLWVLLLSLWTVAVAVFSRSLPLDMVARVIGVLGLISVGFLLFILTTSNPFERLLPAALDGKDLNPLLQDPGLVIHPPMLYMGYVGMAVAFAFAVAALMSGRLDAAWARWSRPWTVVAWTFLTFGIGLGSWWAYYELGWGGWWFWDPVENASLMPWLVGTALIHSLMVTEKRGSFKAWTVLLAIAAFSLSLLGTFLVRSGVLTSVHAFASDPKRGVFILVFLAVVVGASLTLFAWRAPRVALGGRMELVSRESFLLANSVLLVVATAAVLLGTIYPLIIDALNMGKLSVGPPYFNAVFAPLLVPTVFLMIPGSVARWRDANVREIAHKLRWTFAGAVALAVLLPFVLGGWSIGAAFGLFLGCWVALGTAQQVLERLHKPGRIGASFWGQHIAHFGMAVLVIGITGVKCYEVERDVRMHIGDVVTIAPYTFRLNSLDEVRGPNYKAVRADVQVLRNDKIIEILQPEKRRYFSSAMAMTEAGIDSGFMRDLYVSLGEPLDDARTEWSMRVYYKPFVPWLWGGVLLMVLGGVLAALDRRYRK
ncbi:heme lyase CcmF/NrfE family subunit [Limnohabitans sp. TEGF004]|jgi:cytochrome c-type biogenesis protein CcmF|uniref:heme lyase CcmF/NrfE family subunit n=1 Tax=Limnohabitans sp. TEGF004 TaxID=2986281 RepID=UPI002377CC3F|nr:heme lyase CcmF/NrfE family subunit [Limnohabitans sp. TEGF004]BDU56432.1 cytochrome c-type biogenesis protein CcmF [Limnohabitans sp. TEGF004]